MRPSSRFVSKSSSVCLVLALLTLNASASWFMVNSPADKDEWVNNQVHTITWYKGVLDGINGFDVEIARMYHDGLRLVARNVPTKPKALNIMLQDVPAGDDYFLIFINSTHGVMHATSSRFSILDAGATASKTSAVTTPDPSIPTVTISGSPNPTMQFATTFPAIIDNAARRMADLHPSAPLLTTLAMCFLGWLFGALWTLGW